MAAPKNPSKPRRAPATRRPRQPRTPSVLEAPRDYLGDKGRAQVVANQMIDLASQRETLRGMRIANGHEPDAPVPGLPPGEGGKLVTYGDREAHFTSAISRLEDAYSDLMPLIEELLANR